ncbi:hypothetical protein V6N11_013621 [Hibiscus sabdariffa]|uniref:Uncharacterized protein n=1 Tax=Hibiscus sabdariffa TaxID=183260 RepID=A0ABR1ZXY2_9ROSI
MKGSPSKIGVHGRVYLSRTKCLAPKQNSDQRGCSPPTPTPLLSRPACSRGVRGCLCPDGLLVSLEPKTSPFNNHPKGQLAPAESEAASAQMGCSNLPLGWLLKGDVLGSRFTNNPSGQRQPLTPREQAGLTEDRVGVGRAAALLKTIARGGGVLGSRLTNNPSGQRQPLTPREQAGLDRRGVGVGGLQPC